MAESPVENLAIVTTSVRHDWKAVATLLLSLLVFVSGVAWVVVGNNLRAAAKDLEMNTKNIATLKADQAAIETKAILVDKRMDDVLAEMKAMNAKVGTIAESQARMEGYILGKNK